LARRAPSRETGYRTCSRGFGVVGACVFVSITTAAFLYMSHLRLIAPSGAAATAFSEPHAFATLSVLLKEQTPHIAGSPQNAVVRDRIIAELKSMGYAPEVQAAFQCGPVERFPGCAMVENIVAVHRGTGDGKAVLASAHYDSVPAGPGVSDDGAGVAVVLELARAFAARQTRNDIIFLITDGEETGLRGAAAFAEHHALMSHVGVVVNFEARGASGRSVLFETGPGNARLMTMFARVVARPSASSVNYEVYKRLPNDTDFSVYRKLGLSGFNFAFSNSASLYHSARDNLQNIDPRSLQHMGEQAFALTSELADADIANLKDTRDDSFFDLSGLAMVVWPAAFNVPFSLLALAALVGLVFVQRDVVTLRAIVRATLLCLMVIALLFVAGSLLSYPLGIWPGVHPLDHPQPWPARVAIVTTGVLVPLMVASVVRTRVDPRAILLVNWIALALLAVGVAVYAGGAAYPILWPACGVAIAAWIETLARKTPDSPLRIAALIGFVLAAYFWLGFVVALEIVLGFDLSQYKILALIPSSLALVPVFAESLGRGLRAAWVLCAASALVVVGAAVVASQVAAYTASHPRGLNIIYYDDQKAKPRWLAFFSGAPDETFLRDQGFPPRDELYKSLGLARAKGRFKPAADQHLDAPRFDVKDVATQGTITVVHGVLRGGRNGYFVGIGIPPHSGVRSVRAGNQDAIVPDQPNNPEPIFAQFWGLGSREMPLAIAFAAATPPKLVLFERSPLPDSIEGSTLIAARPKDAAPAFSGDSALVFITLDLKK
jgi:hypothetical protein